MSYLAPGVLLFDIALPGGQGFDCIHFFKKNLNVGSLCMCTWWLISHGNISHDQDSFILSTPRGLKAAILQDKEEISRCKVVTSAIDLKLQ